MASFTAFWLALTLVFCNSLFAAAAHGESQSLLFPLAGVRKTRGPSPSSTGKTVAAFRQSLRGSEYSGNYSSTFKYTYALILSLPIGTPPQNQSMVLDTGSQLSWIDCNRTMQTRTNESTRRRPNPPRPFVPSMSSSFFPISCSKDNNTCTPRIPSSTLFTSCEGKGGPCRYSLFYADGTPGEGSLVNEVFSLSKSQPPNNPLVTIGCADNLKNAEGILGMNQDNLSFPSQTGERIFSYCVPLRRDLAGKNHDGAFILGPNLSASNFSYTYLLNFTESQKTLPSLDEFAYTVNMTGIRIAGTLLKINPTAFVPDHTGSGQTMIDSGTEYTYLVADAYNTVASEVSSRVRGKLKSAKTTIGGLEMCFNGSPREIGRVVGNMTLAFDTGAEILIPEERMADEVEKGISCLGIGSSEMLNVASNIIGNFHQQNLWVEFDLTKYRVGFGPENCSRVL
ncbi:unnamed protein product [Cuscuta campestris]|uniref:Peptidase A1 domain-containing protein n=1 Tax=Cuscuta campestris TaxID=132261 RepID=A0A484NIN5_9ASTE|nr:unnamed protein product [Cuscuta campestris]